MSMLVGSIDRLAAMTATRRSRREQVAHRERNGDPMVREARCLAVAAEMRKLADQIERELR